MLAFGLLRFLALCFLALGALIQHGSEQEIAMGSSAFAEQLVGMYAASLGEWTRWLVILVAFFCMFGTTLTVLDGYARGLHIATLLLVKGETTDRVYGYSTILLMQALAGLGIIAFFRGALAPMLAFAMTAAFLTTPLFAWLNFVLARRCGNTTTKKRAGNINSCMGGLGSASSIWSALPPSTSRGCCSGDDLSRCNTALGTVAGMAFQLRSLMSFYLLC